MALQWYYCIGLRIQILAAICEMRMTANMTFEVISCFAKRNLHKDRYFA